MVSEVAKGSIDDALQLVYDITGTRISKGKAIAIIEGSASDFDPFYEKISRPESVCFSSTPLLGTATFNRGRLKRLFLNEFCVYHVS